MKLWSWLHRWLGVLLAPMMLVWFLSGIGMLFYAFPKVGNRDLIYRDTIGGNLPSLEQILQHLPEGEKAKSLKVTTLGGQPIVSLTTSNSTFNFVADTLLTPIGEASVGYNYIIEMAGRWSEYPIKKVDELHRLDAWIPYSAHKKHFPIYRIKYTDPQKSYLYLSSQTGEALQYCTQRERIEGALSVIPHMLYFWQLRQNRDVWLAVVTWLSGLCAFMCLAGLVVGVQRTVVLYRKRRRIGIPYRRKIYRYHFLFGFIFGIFALMFALSGLLSMQDLPSFIVKQHNPDLPRLARRSDRPHFESFQLDYRKVLQLGRVKEIVFEQFGQTPYYTVAYRDTVVKLDATASTLKPLFLSEEVVLARIKKLVEAPLSIALLTEYDNYYVSTINSATLPVYKVVAEDPDRSFFYVTPTEGKVRYYSTNGRVKKWIYPAFHSLRIKYFAHRSALRKFIITVVSVGGVVLSATGVLIGYNACRRVYRKRSSRTRDAKG